MPGIHSTATDLDTMQEALNLEQKLWLDMFSESQGYRLVWRKPGE